MAVSCGDVHKDHSAVRGVHPRSPVLRQAVDGHLAVTIALERLLSDESQRHREQQAAAERGWGTCGVLYLAKEVAG